MSTHIFGETNDKQRNDENLSILHYYDLNEYYWYYFHLLQSIIDNINASDLHQHCENYRERQTQPRTSFELVVHYSSINEATSKNTEWVGK